LNAISPSTFSQAFPCHIVLGGIGGGLFVASSCDENLITIASFAYDDVTQLFWYSEGIAHIALTDKVRPNRLEPRILQDVL
jgi:hypothetical protein